jgi:hypothetical protein
MTSTSSAFPPFNSGRYSHKTSDREVVLYSKLHSFLTVLICVFLPFQTIGIPVGTTIFDISNILLIILASALIFRNTNKKKSEIYFLYFFIFCIIQFYIFFQNQTNISRFASAFLWISCYIMIFIRGRDIYVPSKYAYIATLFGTITLALAIVFELLVEGVPRPQGFMGEPSTAGLVLLATAMGLIVASNKSSKGFEKFVMLFTALVFVYISFLLRSTHIISAAFSLLLLVAFSRTFDVRVTLVCGLIFVFVFVVALQDPHFQERLDLGSTNSNLSVLSWLQGFDQMMESIRLFPVLGAGLGSTGFFQFDSYSSNALFMAGIGDLNRYDAYSGLFRMVIELGPIFAVLFLLSVGRRLIELWRNAGRGVLPDCNDAKYQIFLFTFAFTLIVGIMLKEPTWSRSQVAVAVLLFYAVPLNAYKVKPSALGQSVTQISNVRGL